MAKINKHSHSSNMQVIVLEDRVHLEQDSQLREGVYHLEEVNIIMKLPLSSKEHSHLCKLGNPLNKERISCKISAKTTINCKK